MKYSIVPTYAWGQRRGGTEVLTTTVSDLRPQNFEGVGFRVSQNWRTTTGSGHDSFHSLGILLFRKLSMSASRDTFPEGPCSSYRYLKAKIYTILGTGTP